MPEGEPAPVMVPLAEPRALSAAERALLDVLVARAGHAGLSAQAGSVVVSSTCSCGCPSVGLSGTGPALSTVDMVSFSGHGRDDVFGIHAYAGDPAGDSVEVVVHVLNGMIEELEIFAGEGIAVALPAAGDLGEVDIY